jgi:epoxyqueuosine reductase
MHGNMKYMENHFDLRVDPQKLVPGARSVITLLKNYYNPDNTGKELKISKYAYGNDYHNVIKDQLKAMIARLQEHTGQFNGRGFVDSAPVLERSWAQRSGLGWIGKNGNLITKQSGSFFFIATLITDLELAFDDPFAKDYCGNCKRCIEACPTEAILPDKTINGSKCISYYTIELKEELIPSEMKDKFQNWMFGCDICQDICPWNRFAKPHQEKQFNPIPEILNLTSNEWESMTEEAFKKIFKHSPLNRPKLKGIQRNIRFLKQE